jgi:hypothetical protein
MKCSSRWVLLVLAAAAAMAPLSGCISEDFKLDSTYPADRAQDVPLNAVIGMTFKGKEYINKEDVTTEIFQVFLVTAKQSKGEQKPAQTDPSQQGAQSQAGTTTQVQEDEKAVKVMISRPPIVSTGKDSKGNEVKASTIYLVADPGEGKETPWEKSAHLRLRIGLVRSESNKYSYPGKTIDFYTAASGFAFQSEGDSLNAMMTSSDVAVLPDGIANGGTVNPQTNFFFRTGIAINPAELAKRSYLKTTRKVAGATFLDVMSGRKTQAQISEERAALEKKVKKAEDDLQALQKCPDDKAAGADASKEKSADKTCLKGDEYTKEEERLKKELAEAQQAVDKLGSTSRELEGIAHGLDLYLLENLPMVVGTGPLTAKYNQYAVKNRLQSDENFAYCYSGEIKDRSNVDYLMDFCAYKSAKSPSGGDDIGEWNTTTTAEWGVPFNISGQYAETEEKKSKDKD